MTVAAIWDSMCAGFSLLFSTIRNTVVSLAASVASSVMSIIGAMNPGAQAMLVGAA